jgi:hypothetical protein
MPRNIILDYGGDIPAKGLTAASQIKQTLVIL